ncbi:hypothetical protein AURDEDRAFT_164909 [Auricularia subglabra TFB-10046 SS5]|nr:hypothetical protein AURDEDRAFT_164909 [Auricularia subglabra TFB-10046 SS5]
MALTDPLPVPRQSTVGNAARQPKSAKAAAAKPGVHRPHRLSAPNCAAAPRATSTEDAGYFRAALTAENLALAEGLDAPPARDGGSAVPSAEHNTNRPSDADAAAGAQRSAKESSPPSRPASRTNSSAAPARPRLVIRIPSLAARRALAHSPSTPSPAAPPAPQKRPRSPTPDSEEDEFAASFMRKRRVSATALL